MTTSEIRSKFLEFFKSKDHAIIPSAPVVPEHDPTVLFTTAGMHPLVPYLLGEPHPLGKRLADSQKCVRTTDIEEVGDGSHLTFFEMLGNWSLGDYFKAESIPWSWEFLTSDKWLAIDPHKLYVTVYEGDGEVPKDIESIELWREQFKSVGIDAKEGERILAMGREDNWWEQGGVATGPAGPDTEIFYYLGKEKDPKFDTESSDFVEIWNNVFMAYQKQEDGSYSELQNKNVDTGMGMERIAAVLQGVDNVYDTDVLAQIKESVEQYALETHKEIFKESNPDSSLRAVRIITDHTRAITFMAADGVEPSNKDQGYVMRRLARRAIREALVLGIHQGLFERIAPRVISLYEDVYPELQNPSEIMTVLRREENIFRQTLTRGLKEFGKLLRDKKDLTGSDAFTLYDTYGFPKELSIEEARRKDIPIAKDIEIEFTKSMEAQKQRSRSATAGQFKGGLSDSSEIATRYHTATHLMYKALRQVLGDHVMQRGSNITAERMRFDFSHGEKMTPEQIAQVEKIVNEVIAKDMPVSFMEKSKDDAFAQGALGAFGEKYPEIVKVYTVGDPKGEYYSKEICGGPHVSHTGEIGKFKITKEESSSAGVRRIKAVIE
ncbi:MAG TPA: alanine--tRNA ligase [Candidatus Saccharibacteria bacterium]|nr:alanine--tRNA ligase [Candidatus Saccharibacteria bacterium]HMT39439.1 alanine--tRNA ligase [Candidatus Saccharibacteria bacterium]